jgi:hypothetical protein
MLVFRIHFSSPICCRPCKDSVFLFIGAPPKICLHKSRVARRELPRGTGTHLLSAPMRLINIYPAAARGMRRQRAGKLSALRHWWHATHVYLHLAASTSSTYSVIARSMCLYSVCAHRRAADVLLRARRSLYARTKTHFTRRYYHACAQPDAQGKASRTQILCGLRASPFEPIQPHCWKEEAIHQRRS